MRIVEFVEDMKQKAKQGLLEVSGTGKCEEKTIPFKIGDAHLITIRGGAIEKVTITHLVFKGIKPPGKDEPQDYMVYQMEVFPENPYCPMGHFNTEWSMQEGGPYNMNLDLFPAIRVEEDLHAMKQAMDRVADKFGRDRSKMREGLDAHYNMNHWAFPLATKTGCKLMELKGQELELFIEAYHTFFDCYLEIIRKRKNTKFTEADTRAKLERNGKWLEYITLKDQAVKLGLSIGLPPEVIIALSFPPGAVF